MGKRALALTGVVGLLCAGGTALAAVKSNPENNKRLGPTANPGYFLGYPSPTYSWHGCTKTSRASLQPRIPQAPQFGKGNAQGAITFTTNRAARPFYSWKAKKGWKICGVQVSVVLSNPNVDSDLLGSAGYTSGYFAGSTAKTAVGETIKVKIAKNAINHRDFVDYEGRTYAMDSIVDVTVFVKKS
jgi:hypothetical protein